MTDSEQSILIKIDTSYGEQAVAFSANGDHVLNGGFDKVEAWRVQDGQHMARMEAKGIYCLAVSKNGRWITGGTREGEMFLWDGETYETVWQHREDPWSIRAIDFSPDSTKLVSASSSCTATIWAIPNRTKVHTHSLGGSVIAARFAPDGDRVATATYQGHVRVWNGTNGRLFAKIPVTVTPDLNHGLIWFNPNHIFVVSDDTIIQLDVSTGSTISKWAVPDSNIFSCISSTDHGNCIAYSTEHRVTFWDPSTNQQLGFIRHSQPIRATALFPQGQFFAASGEDGEIIIENLSRFTGSEISPSPREYPISPESDVQIHPVPQEPEPQTHSTPLREPELEINPTPQEPELQVHPALQESDLQTHSTFQDPVIQLNHAILDAWKAGELETADTLLTIAIRESWEPSNHLLAARALVRARLHLWDDALADADMAIGVQQFIIAYVAKSVAYIGKGVKHAAYRACDIAVEHFHLHHVTLLLHIKAIIVFMAGEHSDAICRMDDLIEIVPSISACYTVQAYMYLVQGNMLVERGNCDHAIESFRRAHARIRDFRKPLPLAISLMSGWKFEGLHITIRQRLCQTLYAAGRTIDAAESLLYTVNTFNEEVYMNASLTKWVSDFTQQCLSATRIDIDTIPKATLTPLLREWAKSALASGGWKVALVAAAGFALPRTVTYSVLCEHLEMIGHATGAVACFLDMTDNLGDDIYKNGPEAKWVCNFTERRLSALQGNHGNTPALQNTFTPLLRAWAKAKLARDSWKDALTSVTSRILPREAVYAVLCEYLIDHDCVSEAIECFDQALSESGGEAGLGGECLEWARDFKRRSTERSERLGDAAVDARKPDVAILHYTTALSLHLASPHGLLIKRSKAYLETGLWKEALDDADQVILLDPSSPWGYQMKHAASHIGGDYDNAIAAFEAMLSKMAESTDPDIQQYRDKYISPSSTRATIQKIVQKIVPHLPRVLINMATGHLHDRAAQAPLFESSSTFKGLVSSTTTRKDYVRIKREVRKYFRYVMLSHKWEQDEPLFHQVIQSAVYELAESPTHDKLQNFCKLVRDSGFNWAWSDTCCIDKSDHFVLQEALVAMFKWYQGCTMMIVFLRGVGSSSQPGALITSIWNTRGWTLQEYIAAKVIHFYTEDWTPYLHLAIPNHKDSPEVISEMEQATGVPAELLMALRPGFSGIREKLRLASTRETTLIEDAAYSLLGIFSVTGLPAIYGEGDGSLGRLLSQVLAGSGDTSILAWTGESGSFNSCLPARNTVFSEPVSSHLPTRVLNDEMATQSPPSCDLDVAPKLYDRLNDLSTPWFSGKRMRLPCIAFELPPFSRYRMRSGRAIYRAETHPFGTLEVRTKHDLSRMPRLYLIHPWLDALLERGDRRNVTTEAGVAPLPSPSVDDEEVAGADMTDDERIDGNDDDDDAELDDIVSLHTPEVLPPPPMDGVMRARRLVAHIRQPFGAILLALTSTGVREDYTRVAADCLIRVQFSEGVSLVDVLENVRTLDVL